MPISTGSSCIEASSDRVQPWLTPVVCPAAIARVAADRLATPAALNLDRRCYEKG